MLRSQQTADLFYAADQPQFVPLSALAADDSALCLRIGEITQTRVHDGYRRVHILLRREGWRDNHKRICCLWHELGLSVRFKRTHRNKSAQHRQPLRFNSCVWSKDLSPIMSPRLMNAGWRQCWCETKRC